MKNIITGAILLLVISTAVSAQNTRMEQANSMLNSETILTYSNLEDAQLIAENNPTVLFFYARWCPSCRTALKNIESNLSKLEDITVIIVNYDKNSELKRNYGVTYQHTYVQIDGQGNKVSLWNGGDIYSILQNVDRNGLY
jgi:thiol-disulfide isomerase/thioredoxin